jgi:hypothetical protein
VPIKKRPAAPTFRAPEPIADGNKSDLISFGHSISGLDWTQIRSTHTRHVSVKLDFHLRRILALNQGEFSMTPPTNLSRPKRQPVPAELGGKWIAWSADGLRIVAHGDTLDECELAAERAGEKDPSFERTPRSDARIIGFRR